MRIFYIISVTHFHCQSSPKFPKTHFFGGEVKKSFEREIILYFYFEDTPLLFPLYLRSFDSQLDRGPGATCDCRNAANLARFFLWVSYPLSTNFHLNILPVLLVVPRVEAWVSEPSRPEMSTDLLEAPACTRTALHLNWTVSDCKGDPIPWTVTSACYEVIPAQGSF